MKYALTLTGQQHAIDFASELAHHLETVSQYEFIELYLNQINGAALCVLVNRDNAFLMFLPDEGSSGFTSRNSDYSGPEDAQIEFRLGNGQRDEYPAQWCVSTQDAIEALNYFLENGQMSPSISWHPD